MMSPRFRRPGFSLIELLVVIVVVGILATVALQSMTATMQDVRQVRTEREMEMLAKAITGDPGLTHNGARSDFGYVGDIGAFPPNLQALRQNPGGYITWNGPYLPPTLAQDSTGFTMDEWGVPYNYGGGLIVSSTGGGTGITKKVADATSDYLVNRIDGTIADAAGDPPGLTYADSIEIEISYPNGFGGTNSKSYQPNSSGSFALDSIPVGTHPLRLIYTPNVDTLHRYLTVLPRHKGSISYQFAAAYFGAAPPSSDTTFEFVPGSDSLSITAQCNNVSFWMVNNTPDPVTISSLQLTWTSPTAYYRSVTIGGVPVFDSPSPKAASGELVIFSSPQIIPAGTSVKIELDGFAQNPVGGAKVDMSGADFTVLLSDGTTFDFVPVVCP